jgi:hypothetical protein
MGNVRREGQIVDFQSGDIYRDVNYAIGSNTMF